VENQNNNNIIMDNSSVPFHVLVDWLARAVRSRIRVNGITPLLSQRQNSATSNDQLQQEKYKK
jgi:hypothetical protein